MSDLSFCSLVLWQEPYQVFWTIIEDFLCLRCHYQGSTYFLPPLGKSPEKLPLVMKALKAYTNSSGLSLRICSIPKNLIQPMQDALYEPTQVIEDRAHWDYVYPTQYLIDLKGRRYQHQRNSINKFKQTQEYSYHKMTTDTHDEVLDIFGKWAKDHSGTTVREEQLALEEALTHFDTLNLKGGYLSVNGRMVAFSLGSLITRDMALIHFEKALPEYSGAYAVINQEFLRDEWFTTKAVNREDDLGLPGLREAKKRYHPVRMIEKYIMEWD